MTLAVQRLGDEATAREATVLTTAAALKTAEDVRRDTNEQSWSPIQRLLGAVGGIAALAAIVGVLIALFGNK